MGILSCFSYSILIVYCSNRNVFKFHKMLFFPQTPFLKHLPRLWHSTCTPFWSQAWVFAQSLSRVRLFATPWTLAHQAPLCMGFPRQEYWNGLPFSFFRGSSWPRDRTQFSCLTGRIFTTEPPGKPKVTTTEVAYSYVKFKNKIKLKKKPTCSPFLSLPSYNWLHTFSRSRKKMSTPRKRSN